MIEDPQSCGSQPREELDPPPHSRHFPAQRQYTSPQHTAERLEQLTACFLRFRSDGRENIRQLAMLAGQILGATCSIYTRLQDGRLITVAHWHGAEDRAAADESGVACLCGDIIMEGGEHPVLIHHLLDTVYATTDPIVAKYQLQTWMGQAVRTAVDYIGALCVAYNKEMSPTEEDMRLLAIIGSAIGIEEQRRQADAALAQEKKEFDRLRQMTMEREDRVIALKQEVNAMCQQLGLPPKYRM